MQVFNQLNGVRMKYIVIGFVMFLAGLHSGSAQKAVETFDSSAIAQIKDEGMNRSQIMDVLSTMTDVYGPRLSWSPGYKRAADWARKTLESWGLENAHLESFTPMGKGWTLKSYSANVRGNQNFPLNSFPKAWSPGVSTTADIIHLDVATDSALQTYRGKLKGKFVMVSDTRDIAAHFAPEATREADSTLLELANADDPANSPRRRRFEQTPEAKRRSLLDYNKLLMCEKEGAAGILTIGRGDGGTIFVQQASVPSHPDTPFAKRVAAYNPSAPKILPQIQVGAEHYNRIARMLKKGETLKLAVSLEVNESKVDSGYNVIAELPGTDLKDEVVMVGAHFDSWHAATGATDNATGSAVCMEALRIIKTLGLKPRRTIRIALWGAEEQGLMGSEAYVKEHLGEKQESSGDQSGKITYKPAADKFSVYFNNDNGTGKVRGVFMQGNELARPVFRAWLKPFESMGASTLTLRNTGGTDHLSFDAIGIPGFQFIQDEIEYGTRTHHSNMDYYDRVQPEDLKQAAVLMASFAYNAAMRPERFPRKPLPAPQTAQGAN